MAAKKALNRLGPLRYKLHVQGCHRMAEALQSALKPDDIQLDLRIHAKSSDAIYLTVENEYMSRRFPVGKNCSDHLLPERRLRLALGAAPSMPLDIFPLYVWPSLSQDERILNIVNKTGLSIRTHIGNTPRPLARYVDDLTSLLTALGLAHPDADLSFLARAAAKSQIQATLDDGLRLFEKHHPALHTATILLDSVLQQDSPRAMTRLAATARALLHNTALEAGRGESSVQAVQAPYMPLEHRFAMYAPLFMPLFLPVLWGQVRATRAYLLLRRAGT